MNHSRRIRVINEIRVKRRKDKRNCLMSELLYIPEHLMRIEAGTGLGSRTRQITMTDNLGTGKHLMKDGQQVRQPFSLGRRTGVARQSVLVQPTLIAYAYGTMVVLHGVSPYFQQHAVLRHRTVRGGYRSDTQSCGTYALDGHGAVAPQCSLGCIL